MVASEDGLDEISVSALTHVVEVNGQDISRYTIAPEDLEIPLADLSDPGLQGGTPAENAAVTRAILAGEQGPAANLAVINAAGAIYASGAVENLNDGVQAARAALTDGSAARALESYIKVSPRLPSGTEHTVEHKHPATDPQQHT